MTHPTATLTRSFAAPPSQVFRAWTEPTLLAQWFLPPGFTNALCEVDLRPEGCFRVHMQAPDGQIYPTQGRYLEIRAPEAIVYLDSWDDDRAENLPVHTTIAFEAHDGGTRVEMTSRFTSAAHRDEVLAQGVMEGWELFFGNLDNLLARLD